MNTPPRCTVQRLLVATAIVTASPAWAISCDELRAHIEARLHAGGVQSYTLAVVAANAPAPGKLLGSCELGSKKIYQVKDAATPARTPAQPVLPTPAASATPKPAAAPAPKPAPQAAPAMITECDNGSSVTQGTCRP